MRHSIERGKLWDALVVNNILQRLHRNITANQLINYDILRQQQSELIQRQKQEQLWMERMKTMEKTLETSLKESQKYAELQTSELAHAQLEFDSLIKTLSRMNDEYEKAIDLLVDMAVERMTTAVEKEEETIDQVRHSHVLLHVFIKLKRKATNAKNLLNA
ncbi:unnamed protein product [Umbelopsis vinacea]